MFFHTTPYHHDLIKDFERLAVFNEAINSYFNDVIKSNNDLKVKMFDLGCGSGILSFFASKYDVDVIAIDKDFKSIEKAKLNLKDIDDINFINDDVLNLNFKDKADLIVCEMLDTGLIDEEEAPVINHILPFLKDNGVIIPKGIINIAYPLNMNYPYIVYDDSNHGSTLEYDVLGDFVVYDEIDFDNYIDLNFKSKLHFKITKDSLFNGIKIITFTKLNDNLISGPTPMLNPPICIPINEKSVKKGDFIDITLEYVMGGGLESIKVYY
ncbi:methyltransferase domain-containing protein [Methanobrevibacter filiformis]|uniref:Ribosomal protein L11 methyltransferase n=1 Tax=Methanobrevibacter filiformis TaxID=55758 RepID=A0A166BL27_9EURY|nr:methyltransferase domain-containing protein [Methanobrevibacter filiformis]KZX13511.1 ribosomal protein L11 methyltransferase [Methanobrevibacter filiformis]